MRSRPSGVIASGLFASIRRNMAPNSPAPPAPAITAGWGTPSGPTYVSVAMSVATARMPLA